MSGAGSSFDPMMLMYPQQELEIQRRQMLAQMLMQNQTPKEIAGYPTGPLSYGADAISKMLGAYEMGKAFDTQKSLYQGLGGGGQPQAPIPAPAPGASATASGTGLGALQNPQAQQPPAPQQPSQPNGPGGMMAALVPDIPGVDPSTKMLRYLQNPQEYMKAYFDSIAMTPDAKAIASVYGYGTPSYYQALGAKVQHDRTMNLRQGSVGYDPATGQSISIPNASGVVSVPLGNGQFGAQLAPGASQAIAGSNYASTAGANAASPGIGYVNNQPVPTNKLALTGNDNVLGLPGQGGGTPAPTAQPSGLTEAGAQAFVRGMFPGAVVSSGQRTPAHNAAVGGVPNSMHITGQAVDFVLPRGMTFDQVKQQFAAAGVPTTELINEGNHVHWGWGEKGQSASAPTNSPMLPELPPGQAKYVEGQAKDAADRHDATVAAAQESPMRINVLDNIIGLSQQGVATGPGQDWQNTVLGYIANAPGLSTVMSGQKDNVARFQELQKFTYQNALRSWQAAGGTGTDAQMEAASHANPNDHLFPQALQAIAKWGKAAELAVQGKANAQDQFLGQNGQTPQNQIKFENAWRNAFDPKVFQYSLMNPAEKAAFAKTLTQAQAKALITKQQQLKAMGALP